MKTFYDLQEDEKAILTEEKVSYYAKLECANKGVIIPQKPISEIKEIKPPTKKCYTIGYESIAFETEADAQAYLDAKNKSFKIRSIGNNYDTKNYVEHLPRASKIKTVDSALID